MIIFSSLHIGEFERVRYYLKKFKLIKDGPTSIDHSCGEDENQRKNKGCVLGYATHSCAMKVSLKSQKLLKNHNPYMILIDSSKTFSSNCSKNVQFQTKSGETPILTSPFDNFLVLIFSSIQVS